MQVPIERLIAVHAEVAVMTCQCPELAPVFKRLDIELEHALAKDDPVSRARALAKSLAA